MNHYLNPNNNQIHAYEPDGSQDSLIPPDFRKLSDEEFTAIQDKAEADRIAALSYSDLRAIAYPSMQDQLDAIWKGGAAAESMKAAINAVKTRHPKG
jgi:hypothetical protein